MLRDFFKEHKLFVFSFVFFALVLIGINVYTHRSLIDNGPDKFLPLLFQQEEGCSFYILDFFYKIKTFSLFLLVLPYNLLVPFIPDIPLYKIDLFAFSSHISLFCVLLLNYIIARKTKRFDVAACAFAFYALFYIPNSVDYFQEVHIAIMLQFIILQYFLTKEKLGIYDYIIAGITAVLCMASYESQIFFGIILVLFTFIYAKKNPENLKLKYAIGIAGLLMAIVGIILLYPNYDILKDDFAAFNRVKSLHFQYSLLFTTLGIFFITINAFLKRNFSYSDWKKIIVILILAICYLGNEIEFLPNSPKETFFYTFALFYSLPVFILLLLSDLFGYTKKNQCLFGNIVVISCIIGFLQIGWQINSCRIYLDYINTLKNKINNSEQAFFTWKKEDMKMEFWSQDFFIGSELRSLFLADKNKINAIMINNDKSFYPISKLSVEDNDIILMERYMPIKGKYWDLSDIASNIHIYEKIIEESNINSKNKK